MIVNDLLSRNVRNRPEKEMVYCEPCNLRLTYREFDQRVNIICNMLSQEGILKGEKIAIISPNCHTQMELIMAAAKGGYILVEIDHRLSSKEVEYIIDDSGARILFVGRGCENVVSKIGDTFPALKKIDLLNEYDNILSSYPNKEPETSAKEEDILMLLYTSGTTGKPKGCILTHKNMISMTINSASTIGIFCEADITMHTSPFSHIAAIWPFLVHCYHGGSNVIPKNLDPMHLLETIENEKVTTWNTVPVVIQRVVDTPEKGRYDISSLRCVSYGASPIAIPVLKEALKYFGKTLCQVYGATETGQTTFLSAHDHKTEGSEQETKRLSSCGKEVLNAEIKIIKPDGTPVATGESGELILRGDFVSQGYWRKPEETKNSMKGGWFYSGDLAAEDSDKFIYITGRKKDLIVSGGENVAPREIEAAIHEHPAVKEVVVVGLPHRKWGEAVTCFVVLQSGAKVSEDDIMTFCRTRLAGYKRPKAIVFVDDFPRTSSGKVLARELRSSYANKFEKE